MRRWESLPPTYLVLVAEVAAEFAAGRPVPCTGFDPELWYDEANEASAVKLCAGCPVVLVCFEHAMSFDEHGVWGATTRADRLALADSFSRTP